MQFGRRLMESRPYFSRIPDDSAIVPAKTATSVPGAGLKRMVATRDSGGSYAMVYTPVGRPFKVRMNVISGSQIIAWWFNPRDGNTMKIGEFANTGEKEFTPPDKGEMIDWVLVLDDAAKKYPPPGRRE